MQDYYYVVPCCGPQSRALGEGVHVNILMRADEMTPAQAPGMVKNPGCPTYLGWTLVAWVGRADYSRKIAARWLLPFDSFNGHAPEFFFTSTFLQTVLVEERGKQAEKAFLSFEEKKSLISGEKSFLKNEEQKRTIPLSALLTW